jgi:hypothetical protein
MTEETWDQWMKTIFGKEEERIKEMLEKDSDLYQELQEDEEDKEDELQSTHMPYELHYPTSKDTEDEEVINTIMQPYISLFTTLLSKLSVYIYAQTFDAEEYIEDRNTAMYKKLTKVLKPLAEDTKIRALLLYYLIPEALPKTWDKKDISLDIYTIGALLFTKLITDMDDHPQLFTTIKQYYNMEVKHSTNAKAITLNNFNPILAGTILVNSPMLDWWRAFVILTLESVFGPDTDEYNEKLALQQKNAPDINLDPNIGYELIEKNNVEQTLKDIVTLLEQYYSAQKEMAGNIPIDAINTDYLKILVKHKAPDEIDKKNNDVIYRSYYTTDTSEKMNISKNKITPDTFPGVDHFHIYYTKKDGSIHLNLYGDENGTFMENRPDSFNDDFIGSIYGPGFVVTDLMVLIYTLLDREGNALLHWHFAMEDYEKVKTALEEEKE